MSDGALGRLVLVGTPIGNLGDLSPRAAAAMAEADILACEDTRHTRKLLTAAGITPKRIVAVHAHNEQAGAARLVEQAQAGATVALVTDAGMPGISDPGQVVVAAAVAAGVPVEVVPGPSAVVAAVAASGLPTDRFVFEGFLPRKGPGRRRRLAGIASESRTVVLFESPHRLAETLADLAAACGGERPVAVARELTKLYEEVWRGSLAGAARWAAATPPRGEVAVVVGGAPEEAAPVSEEAIEAALGDRLDAGATRKDAVGAVAQELGVAKREVYAVSVRMAKERRPPE